ncbi:MAG: AraC family transcriptional regulator, partial [Calditrichaeota bacterium]|nr:AraC family transcriptional regulator [Calditrichota bacterium]
LLSKILSEIFSRHGNISIGELVDRYSVSELKLRRLFYNQVGINPKTYCKIKRLNYFLSNPKHMDQRLTKTTFDMGYFDQSHFIRDIKTVTGRSPKHCHLNYFQQQFTKNPLQLARGF